MPKYKIRPGESFRDSDGSIKGGGETIELCDEMAAVHRDRIEPLPEENAVEPAASEASGEAPGGAHRE